MQASQQTTDLLDQPSPEDRRLAKQQAMLRSADFWAQRVPHYEGANKVAAIRACLANLREFLRA